MHRSTGSLLHKSCSKGKAVVRSQNMSDIHSSQIRFFSPHEMLRIFGFPDCFSLPESMTNRQKYRVIGQSVNVITVQAMMHSVLCTVTSGCSILQSRKRTIKDLIGSQESKVFADSENSRKAARRYQDDSTTKNCGIIHIEK